MNFKRKSNFLVRPDCEFEFQTLKPFFVAKLTVISEINLHSRIVPDCAFDSQLIS